MIVYPVTLGEEVESAEILPLSDFHCPIIELSGRERKINVIQGRV